MKQYKEKKTGMIWVAVDEQHIKYFDSNPNFIEIKNKKFDKKKIINTNIKKEDNSNK